MLRSGVPPHIGQSPAASDVGRVEAIPTRAMSSEGSSRLPAGAVGPISFWGSMIFSNLEIVEEDFVDCVGVESGAPLAIGDGIDTPLPSTRPAPAPRRARLFRAHGSFRPKRSELRASRGTTHPAST